MIWLAMGGTLLGTVLTGAILGASLGLTGFVILHVWSGGATSLGVQAVWNTFNSFTLTAIPLFILLGELLVASGLARGVYRAMSPVFARLPGGCCIPISRYAACSARSADRPWPSRRRWDRSLTPN